MTFTPLLGLSPVVARFLMDDSSDVVRDRHVTRMTIDDAPHFSEAQKARILTSYAPHELDARARGKPALGSGRVFTLDEDEITDPDLLKHYFGDNVQ